MAAALRSYVQFFTRAEPTHWRRGMPLWFKASTAMFAFMGACTWRQRAALSSHAPWVPWGLFAAHGVVQSLLSYMADVQTCGRRSLWKVADCLGATVMMAVGLAILVGSLAGTATFPPELACTFALATAGAVACKARGSAALAAGRIKQQQQRSGESGRAVPRRAVEEPLAQAYWRFHSLWHMLPCVAGACMLEL